MDRIWSVVIDGLPVRKVITNSNHFSRALKKNSENNTCAERIFKRKTILVRTDCQYLFPPNSVWVGFFFSVSKPNIALTQSPITPNSETERLRLPYEGK